MRDTENPQCDICKSQKSGYHKNIRTKTQFPLWLSCRREEREVGLVFAWFYPSVLSQAFPGDTENPIDHFQGNMLGIENREYGGSTGDNMILFHKQNTKISTFPSELKGTIKKYQPQPCWWRGPVLIVERVPTLGGEYVDSSLFWFGTRSWQSLITMDTLWKNVPLTDAGCLNRKLQSIFHWQKECHH